MTLTESISRLRAGAEGNPSRQNDYGYKWQKAGLQKIVFIGIHSRKLQRKTFLAVSFLRIHPLLLLCVLLVLLRYASSVCVFTEAIVSRPRKKRLPLSSLPIKSQEYTAPAPFEKLQAWGWCSNFIVMLHTELWLGQRSWLHPKCTRESTVLPKEWKLPWQKPVAAAYFCVLESNKILFGLFYVLIFTSISKGALGIISWPFSSIVNIRRRWYLLWPEYLCHLRFHFRCWSLPTNVLVFEHGPMGGDQTMRGEHSKIHQPEAATHFRLVRIQPEACLLTRTESSADIRAAGSFVLNFPIPRAVRNDFLLFVRHPVCDILLW